MTMTIERQEEIAAVVREVMRVERNELASDQVVLKAMSTILVGFGIEEEDRLEFRRDLLHLRKWRKSAEEVQRMGFRIALTVLITGTLGAVWLGIKVLVGK